MIIKHGRHIFRELQEVRQGMWAVFLLNVLRELEREREREREWVC